MDSRMNLFKKNSSVSDPQQHKEINRTLQNATRAKQRRDLYLSTRNISPGPVSPSNQSVFRRNVSASSTPAPAKMKNNNNDNKENANITTTASAYDPKSVIIKEIEVKVNAPMGSSASGADGTYRVNKIACLPQKDPQTMSKQEAFVRRFLERRQKQKEEATRKLAERPPFVPVARNCGGSKLFEATSSFAPNSKHFNLPELPSNPLLKAQTDQKKASVLTDAKRKSLFTVVPTPPRKRPAATVANASASSKPVPTAATKVRNAPNPPSKLLTSRTIMKHVLTNIATQVTIKKGITKATATQVVGAPSGATTGSRATTGTNIKTQAKKQLSATTSTSKATSTTASKHIFSLKSMPSTRSGLVNSKSLLKKPLNGNKNIAKLSAATSSVLANKPSTFSNITDETKKVAPQKTKVPKTTNEVKKLTHQKCGVHRVLPANGPTSKPPSVAKPMKVCKTTDEAKSVTPQKSNINGQPLSFEPTNNPSNDGVSHPTPKTATEKAGPQKCLPNLLSLSQWHANKPACEATTFAKPSGPGPSTGAKKKELVPAAAKSTTVSNVGTKGGGAVAKSKALREKKLLEAKTKAQTAGIIAGKDKLRRAQHVTSKKMGRNIQGPSKSTFSNRLDLRKTLLDIQRDVISQITTPTESLNIEDFQPELTSTRQKSTEGSHPMVNLNEDSVLATDEDDEYKVNKHSSSNSSTAKRALLQQENQLKRFRFVRYSEGDTLMEASGQHECNATLVAKNDSGEKRVIESKVEEGEKTLTPGKVTLEKGMDNNSPCTSSSSANADNGCAIAGTLEAVRCFRLQLQKEITRLHEMCAQWETYKAENAERLAETGGEDMINVTIGQTKLLTSKKFMQFNGLIERCEAQAKGEGPKDDGSEDTKLITPIDLEGFWSMLHLQVEDLDKRFLNMDRWKANNWVDPDERNKIKNPTKVRKAKGLGVAVTKAKANSALQQMLREARKKAAQAEAADVETPTRKRRSASGTPCVSGGSRRMSVVVQDRKARSGAPTVVVLTPKSSHKVIYQPEAVLNGIGSSAAATNCTGTPKLNKEVDGLHRRLSEFQKSQSNDLLKTVLRGEFQCQGTPGQGGAKRKSILKTPGTKSKPKTTKFRFVCHDTSDEDDEQSKANPHSQQPKGANGSRAVGLGDCSHREEKCTYNLRNREVVLCDPSEIVIPK